MKLNKIVVCAAFIIILLLSFSVLVVRDVSAGDTLFRQGFPEEFEKAPRYARFQINVEGRTIADRVTPRQIERLQIRGLNFSFDEERQDFEVSWQLKEMQTPARERSEAAETAPVRPGAPAEGIRKGRTVIEARNPYFNKVTVRAPEAGQVIEDNIIRLEVELETDDFQEARIYFGELELKQIEELNGNLERELDLADKPEFIRQIKNEVGAGVEEEIKRNLTIQFSDKKGNTYDAEPLELLVSPENLLDYLPISRRERPERRPVTEIDSPGQVLRGDTPEGEAEEAMKTADSPDFVKDEEIEQEEAVATRSEDRLQEEPADPLYQQIRERIKPLEQEIIENWEEPDLERFLEKVDGYNLEDLETKNYADIKVSIVKVNIALGEFKTAKQNFERFQSQLLESNELEPAEKGNLSFVSGIINMLIENEEVALESFNEIEEAAGELERWSKLYRAAIKNHRGEKQQAAEVLAGIEGEVSGKWWGDDEVRKQAMNIIEREDSLMEQLEELLAKINFNEVTIPKYFEGDYNPPLTFLFAWLEEQHGQLEETEALKASAMFFLVILQ